MLEGPRSGRRTLPRGAWERGKTARREAAEEYLAFCVPFFLAPHFARLRILCSKLSTAVLGITFAATTYSFHLERAIMYIVAALALSAAGFLIWILIRINRNELVSRVCRTSYDRFTPDGSFLTSLMTVVLPLVLLSAAQLGGRFRVLFEPLLNLFR